MWKIQLHHFFFFCLSLSLFSFSVRNLCPNTSYAFSVTAYNKNGESPESVSIHGKTTGATIQAPTNLKAVSEDINKATLTWQPAEGDKKVCAIIILSPSSLTPPTPVLLPFPQRMQDSVLLGSYGVQNDNM